MPFTLKPWCFCLGQAVKDGFIWAAIVRNDSKLYKIAKGQLIGVLACCILRSIVRTN